MAKYYIHCCPKREWYVNEFLVPSMFEQGIQKDDILIYNDVLKRGNLRAWVESCEMLVNNSWADEVEGVWHLQDDIVLSKYFKEKTEEYDRGLVCGFTCYYDHEPEVGEYSLYEEKLWFSFPCIRIPNYLLINFVRWQKTNLWRNPYFRECVTRGKGDDLVFREYLYYHHSDVKHLNLSPNLVDHIDYLLGGSTVNKWREVSQPTRSVRSGLWEDNGEVDELIDKLKRGGYYG